MKRISLAATLVFACSAWLAAQTANDKPVASTDTTHQNATQTKAKAKVKAETQTTDKSGEVQPVPAPVKITPDLIKAAQQKLDDKGYKAGQATGRMNASTRRALRSYQRDEKLKVTGQLNDSTLTHLNVGAGSTIASAPADIGRGGNAAGHDIKEGHPVAAAKALGKGVGRFGKKVGEGTKSAIVGTKDKVQNSNSDKDKNPEPPK
jgi:peptidoglycan hydrolase-like protein with peptidoglycan-binding domain